MEQDVLFAVVTGVVEIVNTVISVTPVKTRYNGEFVEVMVGTGQDRGNAAEVWVKVDINSRLEVVLMLSSVTESELVYIW